MEQKDVNLKVEGMHCGSCVNRLTKAVQQVPGVEVVSVQVGSAHIKIDEDQAKLPEVLQAIEETGFAAREA